MNAPLSRYLTRFAAEAVIAAAPPAIEPTLILTISDLDARLKDARASALAEAEAGHSARRDELEQAQAMAVTDAVAAARAEWCNGTAGQIAASVERAFATLRTDVAEASAKVLRPLLAEAARERTLAALEATIARLLADPVRPAVTVRAPADLVAALRARGPLEGIALVIAEATEAVVSCGATRIETQLAAALADIAEA